MKCNFTHYFKHLFFYFGGDQPHTPWIECIQSIFGVFIGLILVLTNANYLGELVGIGELLMAPLGAGLLIFALPQSTSA